MQWALGAFEDILALLVEFLLTYIIVVVQGSTAEQSLLDAFSQLLYERDQADGACRLCQTSANPDEESETE